MREPELRRIPAANDLRNMLASAQRNSQKSIELPFYTAESPVKMTLVVKCEQYGKDVAFWSLYRTDIANLPALWTEQTTAIDLIRNLVELGYSTAVEEHNAQGIQRSEVVSEPESESQLTEHATEVNEEDDPLYLEALRGLSLSDEDFERESAIMRATADHETDYSFAISSPRAPQSEIEVDDLTFERFSQPVSEPVSFDQSLASSKERKQQALMAVLLKLASAEAISCKAEIVEAVRLVINPFDSGSATSAISKTVERDLKSLIKLFGDKDVSASLSETFTAILKGKPSPSTSEIEQITSKWFW